MRVLAPPETSIVGVRIVVKPEVIVGVKGKTLVSSTFEIAPNILDNIFLRRVGEKHFNSADIVYCTTDRRAICITR